METAATITDLAYEAAINAELWPQALEEASRALGAVSGELLVFPDAESKPRFKATPYARDALNHWIEAGLWKGSVMQRVALAGAPPRPVGVLSTVDLMPDEDWHADPTANVFKSIGLYDQLFAPVFMPTGEAVFFSFERLEREGRFLPGADEAVAELLPHFSRAALVSSRLGLTQAIAAAETMEALRIPAAVLASSGRVKAVNGLFSTLEHAWASGPMDRIRWTDASADALFQSAVSEMSGNLSVVRSIAIRPRANHPPAVVHVLPLRRTAHEVLFGADILVVVTAVGSPHGSTNAGLLTALFDLTPSEARIASLLGGGESLARSAAIAGVTEKTARTYLERIFAKTGCRRQTELVLLLRDVGSAGPVA